MAWVWVAGLRFLWRSGRPLWRAMAWAYGLLFVLFAVTTGAQTYYLGARVRVPARCRRRGHRRMAAGPAPPAAQSPAGATALTTAVAVLVRVPGAPARRHQLDLPDQPDPRRDRCLAPVREDRRERVDVAAAGAAGRAVLYTGNYGEAARDQRTRPGDRPATPPSAGRTPNGGGGPATRAPPWSSRSSPDPSISPAPPLRYLRQFFTHVRVAATLSNPYGIHNQEWGGHVYVCTGLRHPWAQLWPRATPLRLTPGLHVLDQSHADARLPARPATSPMRCSARVPTTSLPRH